jgi:hypothetical protein
MKTPWYKRFFDWLVKKLCGALTKKEEKKKND